MLPVKRLDHVSMAAPDWRAQSAKLERLLGFKHLHSFEPSEATPFEGSVSQVRGTGIEFEIIAPWRGTGFVQQFLEQNGPGLHHVTIEVHDIEAAAAALEGMGIRPFGGITEDGMWRLTYIHPNDSGGILWQLFVPLRMPPDADRNAGGGAVNVLRMDHVSMAVPELDRQVEWQTRVFGMEENSRWRDDAQEYEGVTMTIPGSLLQFEIIAPTTPTSFVRKFLDARRAGMHHICCEVASVEDAIAGLRAEGIEPHGGGSAITDPRWKRHTFLHPRDSGGVLFQLFEEPAG
ncbi:MAG: VOC family protein [Tepidiformaceae bacterium]